MIITHAVIDQDQPTPVEPPTPEPPVAAGFTVYLTGADGSVWDLTNGPVRLTPGVVGLLPSNVAHRWKTSPTMDGAVRVGYSLGTQKVQLPVVVAADTSLDWRDLDVSLWRALDPDAECRLTVVSPDAETRVLPAWFTGVGDNVALPLDPMMAMLSTYALEFEAEDPYWQGAVSSQTFRPTTPLPYYAPPGSAFVKTLMPNDSTANSTLRNEGEVPAWVTVAVSGSTPGFTVTVDDGAVSYGEVADDQTVWIDYHPARQTVGFARGTNSEEAWAGVTSRQFRPVPPGAEVPIGVALTTPGANASVTFELTPRYRRAW